MIGWKAMGHAEHFSTPGAHPCARSRRLMPGIIALLVGFIMPMSGIRATDEAPAARSPAEPPAYGDQIGLDAPTPWLDEVRAQRQGWENRRDAARNAFEARRRANNPRAAAQQEAWEDDVRRRRAARLERLEQDRELFRSFGPSQMPLLPWPWTTGPAAPPELGSEPVVPAPPHEEPLFAPPGWDNHWYFRGF